MDLVWLEMGFLGASSQYTQSKLQIFSKGLKSTPKDSPKRLELTGPKMIFAKCFSFIKACLFGALAGV